MKKVAYLSTIMFFNSHYLCSAVRPGFFDASSVEVKKPQGGGYDLPRKNHFLAFAISGKRNPEKIEELLKNDINTRNISGLVKAYYAQKELSSEAADKLLSRIYGSFSRMDKEALANAIKIARLNNP